MSFTPTSFYDILRGDYLTMNPMGPGALDDSPDAYYQTGGSFYYPPCTSTGAGNELETLFPTYDSFYPSSTPAPSMSSGDLSVSWGSTPTTWSGASFDDLFNPSNGQDVQRMATNDSRREQGSPPRPRKGPNRRRPGTGYAELMVRRSFSLSSFCVDSLWGLTGRHKKDKLPQEVQEALTQTYQGCCEVVVKKDISTVQKHQFSNRHCANLPPELQEVLPSFTCPAFVAMHESCRSAKYVSSPPPPVTIPRLRSDRLFLRVPPHTHTHSGMGDMTLQKGIARVVRATRRWTLRTTCTRSSSRRQSSGRCRNFARERLLTNKHTHPS